MKTKRIIIYPKDVQRITGKSARYGRTLLNKIRESKLKTKNQFISVNEFADFTGLSVEEITSYLQD
jgi:Fic family protein